MNMRVRQLWAPVLSTFLVSVSVQFVALRVPQLPPYVCFTRNGVSIVLAPLWVLALPFIGALGAWLSLRAGGNTRDRLLAALGSAWLKLRRRIPREKQAWRIACGSACSRIWTSQRDTSPASPSRKAAGCKATVRAV